MKKLIFTVIFMFFAANLYAGEIAVIVNESGPLTQISEADIREIYLGNIRFIKGVAVTPLHYREGSIKDTFLSSIIDMNSREYRVYWTKKIFQEGGSIPVSQNSFGMIILTVKKDMAVIGYVPISELKETEGIKIIKKIAAK
ncbi:MAG: hypothetical protein A2X87_07665 [Deltaproteobacteria bacterium GWC2_42_51]|nr:MAG: hypothetical protein A2067_04860 [Deltaproteobacteria bacterium GWB2_42_7]OGP34689.1 MAG: hypothetical protein A2X87_07665 [Deltaproteobacteria bacterium GWC2_42_51]OGP42948.1 MAG: hypothetical protein A2090_01610 [Deltaproteobacteria bacterium GWD2_42_10]OGP45732.1 MAG: hypothetical protein A2022_03850 [Deltaproteobacteria bacterium GWF2_42_12]OGQ25579.1 MAG: hypothetical protein A3D29_04880 [Deltaproteobacteria bacterium RIFCSPHIGHO2_02_FULL_42_44]OGQ35288.1 MAG: hypothetical protein